MNIGFVSTWFERGAAYVTKSYLDLLEKKHNVFVFARAGEEYAINDSNWDKDYVTWGSRMWGTDIYWRELRKWIVKNSIDIIFFNEQAEIEPILKLKLNFPNIKVGSYIDYYTPKSISDFNNYDFLICNTLRHYSVFKNHKQCYYVPWGTNIDLYKYNVKKSKELCFFHSCGMSNRKGTDLLIETFIEFGLYKESKLIIHTQKPINEIISLKYKDFERYNIEIINKTVSPPGLYYLGDVYVYPTYLEGLGLTQFEALSSGLPVIVPNNQPMNEIINDNIGKLVEIDLYKTRQDAYYWPLCVVKKEDLAKKMYYYIENRSKLIKEKETCRKYAVERLNWSDRESQILDIFENSKVFQIKDTDILNQLKNIRNKKIKYFIKSF
ncbi:MAG: glycosyltransferase, partial [Clostridium sp.]|uniref:glycosyltransferase n=1 Tax=Clostridium sp. TaxID=1506 RepID=UPI00290A7573